VFYTWQRQLLENMASVLDSKRRSRRQATRERKLEREIGVLREKLAKKDSVIAEISEEYVSLEKELGEL
jgi:nitrogenase molybdenum-iron protein alpha/beta subunit